MILGRTWWQEIITRFQTASDKTKAFYVILYNDKDFIDCFDFLILLRHLIIIWQTDIRYN